jgi:hypothetical protein
MGVRQFDAICEVTAQQNSRATSPDSWDGYESDPFWQAAHRPR